MFTAARPGWFVAIATSNFATHFCSLGFYSDDTLNDQMPRAATGTAAKKQSQP
jgi:hypothetical protein